MLFGSNKNKKSAQASRVTIKELLALVLSVVIVLSVLNFLSSRHFFRVDLTSEKEFTLSKATRDILENLEDVVNLRLYFSKDLPPALTMLKRDVDDVLAEYKTYGGNMLNVQFVDPMESPQREQQVVMMGIPPVQINVIAKDKQELVKVYLGMAVIHEDLKEIIPVVQRTGSLEYELTSAILKVSTKEIPKIKWLSNVEGTHYEGVKDLLKGRYEVQDVKPEDLNLDPTKDALLVMIIEEDLTDSQIVEIDQYLMKGGKILLMIDRLKVGNNLQTMSVEIDNVFAWLKEKNIYVKDKLIRDRSNTHAAFSGGYVTYHVPYPFWVKVGPDGFNKDNPVVSDLDLLILPWASPLEILTHEGDSVTYTALAESSAFNQVVDIDTPLVPDNSNRIFSVPGSEPKPLVVLAEGAPESYQLMVVGNTRFIRDSFLSQFRANALFFENSVDYMAMGNQLIGIRSKGAINRPLEDMTLAKIATVKYINIFFAPLLLIVVGFIILFRRRQRRGLLKNLYK
jgi:ABC-type uncharacterized transport system involved in gliding motility auxiliary subunit